MELSEWRVQAEELADSPRLAERILGVDVRDRWSLNSLRMVESKFLERFTEIRIVPNAIRRDYQQFLGEGLVRSFNGAWVILPGEHLGDPTFGEGYCVRYEEADHMDVTNSMVEIAILTKDRTYWATLFETTAILCAG